ncbi:MAG: hypothetical protein J7L69_06995, partial [Desulfobulbaceae bacterium]|nr:hypothetical protein [Desulfobulbaceae bacterium]
FYYHDIFPNTYYAKSKGSYYITRGLKYLGYFFFDNVWSILLLVVVPLTASYINLKKLAPFLIAIIIQTTFTYKFNGDWMPNFRFFAPVLTLFIASYCLAINIIYKELENIPFVKLIKPFKLVFIFLFVYASFSYGSYSFAFYTRWLHKITYKEHSIFTPRAVNRGYEGPLLGFTDYLLKNARPGASVLMTDIGFPSYIDSDSFIIDWWGLVTKETARFYYHKSKGITKETILSYVLDKLPEHALFLYPERVAFLTADDRFKDRYTLAVNEKQYSCWKRNEVGELTLDEKIANYEKVVNDHPYYKQLAINLKDLYLEKGNVQGLKDLYTQLVGYYKEKKSFKVWKKIFPKLKCYYNANRLKELDPVIAYIMANFREAGNLLNELNASNKTIDDKYLVSPGRTDKTAAEFNRNNINRKNFWLEYQKLKLKKGNYLFGGYLKTQDLSGKAYINVSSVEGWENGSWSTEKLEGNHDWTFLWGTLNLKQDKEVVVMIGRIPEYIKGKVVYDDIFLAPTQY